MLFSTLLYIYPEAGLLDHMISLYQSFDLACAKSFLKFVALKLFYYKNLVF